MKVLHVITCLDDGGAEAVLYRLCCSTRAIEHVVVSLRDEGKYGALLRRNGVVVHSLDGHPRRPPIRALLRLVRRIRSEQPDVVQTWMYHADFLGGVAARIAGVKSIVWGIRNSDLDRQSSSRITIWLTGVLATLSRWMPRAIIVCADSARKIHVSIGYAADKMHVIPNGYDINEYAPDPVARSACRDTLGLPETLPVIANVGRYNPQKDYPTLLKSLRLLKDRGLSFKCLLIGSHLDGHNQELQSLIRQLDLEDCMMLLGRRTDIPSIMNAIDLLVVSSVYGEAFPNVLCEAMACGTPCVSTDVGDSRGIIDRAGWVVPRNDPESLMEAMCTAVETLGSQEWLQLSATARERVVTCFSLDRMADAYTAVWKTLSQGQERC